MIAQPTFNPFMQVKQDIQTIHNFIRLPQHGNIPKRDFKKALARIGSGLVALTALIVGSAFIGSRRVKNLKRVPLNQAPLALNVDEETAKKLFIGQNIKKYQTNDELNLIKAAEKGDLKLVQQLVEKGTNVNVYDDFFTTPLMTAAAGEHKDVIDYLLSNNATLHIGGGQGRVALYSAIKNNYSEVIDKFFEQGLTAPMLIKEFFNAINYGEKEVIDFFLKKNIDINVQNKKQKTALMIAAQDADLELVNFILSRGADVNLQDNKGKSALMYAATTDSTEIITALLKHKATINMKDKQNKTALDYATHQEIKDFLKKHGGVYGAAIEKIPEIGLKVIGPTFKTLYVKEGLSDVEAAVQAKEVVKSFRDLYPHIANFLIEGNPSKK